MRRKFATPAKDSSESTMQKRTRPTANKTSWSNQSAVLLINIVRDVEEKIQRKELLVGKENEKTKWDYVATFLHEASPHDAGKAPNNCQYKFWELNRHFKLLRKEATGKSVREGKECAVFSALKAYYGNCPPVGKKSRVQTSSIALFKEPRSESERQPKTENPGPHLRGNPLPSVPNRYHDAKCESEDDIDGSLRHDSIHTDSVGHLAISNQASLDSAGSSLNSPSKLPTVEVVDPVRKPRGRPKGKRKAIDLENLNLKDVKEKGNSSNRLKQIVDKMARLTSYMKWKQTGIGEEWRCVLTDGIERRQKRSIRKLIKNVHQAKGAETETQVPDEIEAALREDILSCWNDLDKKRPSPEECQKYLRKKYAGEVYW